MTAVPLRGVLRRPVSGRRQEKNAAGRPNPSLAKEGEGMPVAASLLSPTARGGFRATRPLMQSIQCRPPGTSRAAAFLVPDALAFQASPQVRHAPVDEVLGLFRGPAEELADLRHAVALKIQRDGVAP